jgi:terminal uridylyltransferase
MAQNGQLAQHLAAVGGYMRNAANSHTSPSSSMSNAQMHHSGGYASSPYMSAAAAAAAATQNLSYERHTAELTNCIIAFLSPILPTEEEYRIKEATRRQLERLAGKVSPGAKLLAFGSMANGFALRNSGE